MKNFSEVKILFVGLLNTAFLGSGSAQAQQLGLANSNFIGTHSLYRNPSSIADARQSLYLNLFSIDAGVSNNYLRYESPVSIFNLIKTESSLEEKYVKENLNGKPKLLNLGTELRGPALMIRLNSKNSIGFTTRLRGGVQINNLSEDIARLYKAHEGNAEDLLNKVSGNNTVNLNANVYSEMGFSYARVILDRQEHFVKGGFTIKRLAGGFSAHLINEDTQFKLTEDNNENKVLEIDRIKARYGYTNANELENLENLTVTDYVGLLVGRNSPGKGWGTDIGFTYEYRPNWEKYHTIMDGKEIINERKNKYRYRLGISLMDIGSINYKKPGNQRGFQAERTNKRLAFQDFEEAENVEEVGDVLNDALDITDTDEITSFHSGLPTTLNVNLDYKIAGPLYANATWIQDLRGNNAVSMRQFSLLALTPRLELGALELSAPIAWQNNYSVLTVGAMLRLGPFFIGSDNIGGALNMGKPYGANAYAGLAFSIANKKNKDKDKDGVSDRIDKCKKIPGTWELMGCPPPANAVSQPVSAPGKTETMPKLDSVQVPVPDTPTKPAADSLTKTIPDSLNKAIPDTLKNTPLNSLHKEESAFINNVASGTLNLPEVKSVSAATPTGSAESDIVTNMQPEPADKPKANDGLEVKIKEDNVGVVKPAVKPQATAASNKNQ